MGGGDHCAVFGCDNDRRYPEKQIRMPHVGVLRFYSPRSKKEIASWERSIQRIDFKATLNTKVCSNHFAVGYRSDSCWKPTLYMKGYSNNGDVLARPPPKERASETPKRPEKRKSMPARDSAPPVKKPFIEEPSNEDVASIPEVMDRWCQTSDLNVLKRNLFIAQATCDQNCQRYTGLTIAKVNLLFEFVKEKASQMRYWKGPIDTPIPSKRKSRGVGRKLPIWDEFILTLVRTRKRFDVHFLADTFGISGGQVSRIYNSWIIFLSEELSFLVPWPSKDEIRKSLPKRYKKYPQLRIIIDCVELFIQKPKLPSSQKITWSNYKHRNTVKLLVGVTPNGIISFIPPLWTGMVSDKQIVRATEMVNMLEEGDFVMADRGFLIRDLLTFKKIELITPAFCRGNRLSARGTTHTRRVASLRSHVERYILRLKQFKIISGVIPLQLKPQLDRIVFVCAALSNLIAKPIID